MFTADSASRLVCEEGLIFPAADKQEILPNRERRWMAVNFAAFPILPISLPYTWDSDSRAGHRQMEKVSESRHRHISI
jgi:hypothetical protein